MTAQVMALFFLGIFLDFDAGRYVQYTLQLYKIGDVGGPEGGVLAQAPCDHANRVQRGNASVSWTTDELMGSVCKTYCACNWPNCPVVRPDDPDSDYFCSLCSSTASYNKPYNVQFWYPKFGRDNELG